MNTVIKTLCLALSITLVSTSIMLPAESERTGSIVEMEPMLLPPPALPDTSYNLPRHHGSLVYENYGNSLSPNTTPQRTPAATPQRTPRQAHLNQLPRIFSQEELGWIIKTDSNGKRAWYSKEGVRRESISDLPNNYLQSQPGLAPADRSCLEKLASFLCCCCK